MFFQHSQPWTQWIHFNRVCTHPTFWRTALSSDSAFICSFLRLAFSATPSALALARTWAISSFALFEWGDERDCQNEPWNANEFSGLKTRLTIESWNHKLQTWKLTCPVSPQHAPWGFGIAAPPAWSASGSPAHTSSAPPHSGEIHGENI